MSPFRSSAAALLLTLAAAPAAAQQPADLTAPESARTALSLTLYNDGSALVTDRRTVQIPAGESALTIPGLPREVQSTGAVLRAPGVAVVSQRVDATPPTDEALLAASVGQTIAFERVNPATGALETIQARVLAGPPAPLFEVDGKVRTDVPGRPVFDALPAGVPLTPAWSGIVRAEGAAPTVTLAYLTSGLGWRADYVATLAADGGSMDLDALATLTNDTATAFPAAAVKLVAGEVARAPDAPMMMKSGGARMEMMPAPAAAPMMADAAREQIGAFHLYSLDRPVALPAGSVTQHALLTARDVPVETQYRLESPNHVYFNRVPDDLPVHVETRLTFDNTTDSRLGKPLPAGTVRVYAPDSSGALQLVGADRLDHLGEGREAHLTLGRAFDVTAERVQTDFKRLSDRITETAHRVTLKNARDEAVTVRVLETFPGEWQILQASAEAEKVRSDQAAWSVEVPAKGEAELTFRAQIEY